eukprot:15464802-Alexandrium_andersonii.AAC.1
MRLSKDGEVYIVFARAHYHDRYRGPSAAAAGGRNDRHPQQDASASGGGAAAFSPKEVHEAQSGVAGGEEEPSPSLIIYDV